MVAKTVKDFEVDCSDSFEEMTAQLVQKVFNRRFVGGGLGSKDTAGEKFFDTYASCSGFMIPRAYCRFGGAR